MFLTYHASMHWQIETADFNLSSETKQKNKTKIEHFLEIKAKE